ncbi:MAG: extracellular solute-binding protein [Patescibacteria group bacterium]|jgi:multiple sugar transport system substrate-binding protein|nr:extracellular solute-binding protein [Patescibacteria group bacterium]
MRKKFIISTLAVVFVFLSTSGAGCLNTNQSGVQTKPITLTYWRVYDDKSDFDEIIKSYQALHPNIKIDYRRLRYEEYEYELLNALAEDRGPDILSIHNTWVKKYQSKLAPMPPSTTMVYPETQGSIKKEVVNVKRTLKTISIKDLKDDFVNVVSHDVVIDNEIYGLPLSVDTLAMYYNRDLLNNAGIAKPSPYWNEEFFRSVNKLTRIDSKQGILQSGVALGGSENINRSNDILSALMMQSGATMMTDSGSVMFHVVPENLKDDRRNPGIEALQFYTDFANPTKESYSWNNELPNALDMFVSGNLAIIFDYSYNLETIRQRAPKLNFSVTNFPQIHDQVKNTSTNINFANYWVETVSAKSEHKNEAWDFIKFMTSNEEQVLKYLENTNKPTALKELVSKQSNNDELAVFASQVLTAKSWYKGKNPEAAQEAIKNMIKTIVENPGIEVDDIINTTASRVQQTVR